MACNLYSENSSKTASSFYKTCRNNTRLEHRTLQYTIVYIYPLNTGKNNPITSTVEIIKLNNAFWLATTQTCCFPQQTDRYFVKPIAFWRRKKTLLSWEKFNSERRMLRSIKTEDTGMEFVDQTGPPQVSAELEYFYVNCDFILCVIIVTFSERS